jgi:hypothetical protein
MTDSSPRVLIDEEIHERRCLAERLLVWACGGSRVPEEHPHYRIVTANLDPGSRGIHPDPFSSCAVLAHWLYVCMGIREPWVDHPLAAHGWRGDGKVLSRLVVRGDEWHGERLECGDVLVIANEWPSGHDAHVVCVIDQPEPTVLCTAEYGQPGGALLTHDPFDEQHVGRRRIRIYLPLERVLRGAAAEGLLVDPMLPEGFAP